MTSSSEELALAKHTVGFFDLPAELRNQIYDNMLAPRVREHDVGCPLICRITDMLPLWRVTTLCHQFHDEIQSRQRLGVQLVLIDNLQFDPSSDVPRLPEAALRVRNVDVHLALLDVHEHWIRSILNQLQALESLRIATSFLVDPTITPGYANWSRTWQLREPQDFWTSLACLEIFEVHVYEYPGTESIFETWEAGLRADNVFS